VASGLTSRVYGASRVAPRWEDSRLASKDGCTKVDGFPVTTLLAGMKYREDKVKV